MSNVIDQLALDTLRNDFDNLLGIFDYGGGTDNTDAAKTTVTITRVTDRGTLNLVTKLYDSPTVSTICSCASTFLSRCSPGTSSCSTVTCY